MYKAIMYKKRKANGFPFFGLSIRFNARFNLQTKVMLMAIHKLTK